MAKKRKTLSIVKGGADFCAKRGPDPETGKPRGHQFILDAQSYGVCRYCGKGKQFKGQKQKNTVKYVEYRVSWTAPQTRRGRRRR